MPSELALGSGPIVSALLAGAARADLRAGSLLALRGFDDRTPAATLLTVTNTNRGPGVESVHVGRASSRRAAWSSIAPG